jgi:hypothetical protein
MALSSKRQITDGDYLLRRAETEVELAEKAATNKAAATHRTLAGAYFDKLFGDGVSGKPRMNELDVKRENQAAVSALFRSWEVEQNDAGLKDLVQALEATGN